jgi:hypothetical protein
MPLALICACGARLEIDDKFAGQQINCPDCQRPLQAPKVDQPVVRTSGLALASLILALVGAFTILGTLAAVGLGVAALFQIGSRADRLAGRGFAIAGIVVGVVMTAGTVVALSAFELFGLGPMMSAANWSGKLDYSVPLEIVRDREGFAVKRPSEEWGVYKRPTSNGDEINAHFWDDLLIVQPSEDMILLCYAERLERRNDGIEQCYDKVKNNFRKMNKVGLFTKQHSESLSCQNSNTKRPVPVNKVHMIETQIDRKVLGEDKTFLVRVILKEGDDRMYVVITGVRRSHFSRLEARMREAMDGFRLLNRNADRDW